MAVHRPLSAWVARPTQIPGRLGPVNDGDDRADARHLPYFAQGWLRLMVDWDGEHALGLGLADGGSIVVELDDYGTPIICSPEAIELIKRVELTWPIVDGALLADFPLLGREQLPLRYWLLERLDAEGEPPDKAFAVLPWDLLDRAADAVGVALEPAGTIGELVEIRHWLTPAVRGLTGPLEQLDHGLRTADPQIARSGATALLTNLRDLPLSRIPEHSRERLGELVARLGRADIRHRELAETVVGRLADGGTSVPDVPNVEWFARLIPAGYLGPGHDVPQVNNAILDFAAPLVAVLGPNVRGTVFRTGGELTVTLAAFDPDLPSITVGTDQPDSRPLPLVLRGKILRAQVPWNRPELPERLIFRVVAEGGQP